LCPNSGKTKKKYIKISKKPLQDQIAPPVTPRRLSGALLQRPQH